MGMWKYKGCPKCGGDLGLESGLDEWGWLCVQCGKEMDASPLEISEAKKHLGGKKDLGSRPRSSGSVKQCSITLPLQLHSEDRVLE